MSHRNARLTVHGRQLLVRRVFDDGMPVAHVAKAMGISRQCAHRWLGRFAREGLAGLEDRSSRPKTQPRRTPKDVEQRIVDARTKLRWGPDRLGPHCGVPARTVNRVLRRWGIPRLCECDPMTGEVIRSSKATAVRYEHAEPGDLTHMDVKKIGRIPDGGGWRAHGREMGSTAARKKHKIGYDYVHSLVDDHSRLAYSEILPDEKAVTCAEFFTRAIEYFASYGITRIRRLITDNAWSYRNGKQLAEICAQFGITHKFIRPHCPWQNGKVERFNRTLQTEWAYRQVFLTNDERAEALAPWLETYNNERNHSALGGQPPISRLSPT